MALLWPHLISDKIEIGFAYQSFKWTNNAKGNAGVSVVIIGLRNVLNNPKYIFTGNYAKEVRNINPYLIDFENLIIVGRQEPLSNFPELTYGSMPNDGGHLLLSSDEKEQLIKSTPNSRKFIKQFLGAEEFMKGIEKYCLWVNSENYHSAKKIGLIKRRIDKVNEFRSKSKREATKKLSAVPYSFGEVRHQEKDVLLIPQTGSDRRKYVPIGFFEKDVVISNAARTLYGAEP